MLECRGFVGVIEPSPAPPDKGEVHCEPQENSLHARVINNQSRQLIINFFREVE